jgi:hypothetical protein
MIQHAARQSQTARSGAIRGLLLVVAGCLLFLVLSMSGLMIYAVIRGAKESEFDPVLKEQPRYFDGVPTPPAPPKSHPSD